ncbi:hypothetical protein HanRHA438_Chr11g0491351 [Helianthus annuus]|nr:hypothetical protein HanRHA438_Chr11g0491351 [Helianthus annuus]
MNAMSALTNSHQALTNSHQEFKAEIKKEFEVRDCHGPRPGLTRFQSRGTEIP